MLLPNILLALFLGAASPSVANMRIKGSLENSMVKVLGANGRPLSNQVERLLRWQGDLVRDIHPGDHIQIAYEYNNENLPELTAVYYEGKSIRFDAYLFSHAQSLPHFYSSEGVLIEPVLQNSPIRSYTQITDILARGRGGRKHAGIDLKAPIGTPIIAPWEGVVRRKNWSTRFNGLCLEIDFSNGYRGRFLHMQEIMPNIHAGSRVNAHVMIGRVGSTGRSNAPHLHYELSDASGRIADPLKVHGTSIGHLQVNSLSVFKQQQRDLSLLMASVATSRKNPSTLSSVKTPLAIR